MKELTKIAVLCFTLALFACTKEESTNDFEAKRNNIVGKWSVLQKSITTTNGVVAPETSTNLELTFFEDGTGQKAGFFGQIFGFDWVYQYNPEKVMIGGLHSISGGLTVLSGAQLNNVIINEKEEQIWKFVTKYVGQDTLIGDYTWYMTKQ